MICCSRSDSSTSRSGGDRPGQHLVEISCVDCHGENLGGEAMTEDPILANLFAANLTPAGNLSSWSQADFFETIRTGMTPDGRQLDGEWMPWPTLAKMTDDELQAIWLYL